MVREGLFVGRMTARAGVRGRLRPRRVRVFRQLRQASSKRIWREAVPPAIGRFVATRPMERGWR